MKRVLFITPDSLKSVNGGSVLFREVLRSFKPGFIRWFNCSESPEKTILDYIFYNSNYYNSFFFRLYFLNALSRRFWLIGIPFFSIKYKLISYFCYKKAVKTIVNEKVNHLWIYAYHFSIPVCRKIHQKLNIQFHLSVQDDIHTHLPAFESMMLEKDFRYLFENASSFDFVSEEMEKYYREKYNFKGAAMTLMMCQRTESSLPKTAAEISKIGFAGNIWCIENFIILLEALEELDYKYSILIKLDIFTNGNPVRHFEKFKKYINIYPAIKYEDLILKLQQCDLLYLPMSFMPEKGVTSITSFPSKLLLYMNSAVPVFNHSPEYAASHKFVIKNMIGISVTSEGKDAIVDLFTKGKEKLNINHRLRYSENASSALNKFDNKDMINRFINLISANAD